jgi:hypothetical protein
MYTLDALEAINIDQLVTATDRLLLRCKRTTQRPGRRSTIDFSREAAAAIAASKAKKKAAEPEEATVFVRESVKSQELLGAAAIIVGAWLGVVCACLLT